MLNRALYFSPTAKVLLRRKAGVDCIDNNNWTPLHHAATQSNADCVQLLLKYKADIDYQDSWGWSPLMVAAKYGNVKAVVVLLEQEAFVGLLNEDGDTFFDIAIDSRQDEVCKAVLDNERCSTLLLLLDVS